MYVYREENIYVGMYITNNAAAAVAVLLLCCADTGPFK